MPSSFSPALLSLSPRDQIKNILPKYFYIRAGRCRARVKFDWQEARKFDCRLVRTILLSLVNFHKTLASGQCLVRICNPSILSLGCFSGLLPCDFFMLRSSASLSPASGHGFSGRGTCSSVVNVSFLQ